MKRFLLSLSALLLVGCGGSGSVDSPIQTSGSSAGGSDNSAIAGRVVSEGGQAAGGVAIFAQERNTNKGYVATSGADGSFQLQAPPGVYDLAFDHPGDSQTARCYYGPVETSGNQRDFVLRNRNGRNADVVFGKLSLVAGTPATNRRLEFRPGYARNFNAPVLPDSLASVNTQADGSFEVALGHTGEIGFDMEIFDGGGALDEWIKVDKSSKPCYVEVASEQVGAESRLRVNQSDTVVAAVQPTKGLAANVRPFISDPFQLVANVNGGISLLNGILPVQARTGYSLEGLVKNELPSPSNFQKAIVSGSTIELTGDVDFPFSIIYSYQINLNAGAKSNWEFTDETGDTYSLAVIISSSGHVLRYNSSGPKILSMKISPR